MSEHAFCSPSDYDNWSRCPGKPAMEEGEPNLSSDHAAFGTQAHEFAATILRGHPKVEMPEDMQEGVMLYVNAVRERVAAYKLAGAARVELLVEVRLDISAITGEVKAAGTSDVIIIAEFAEHSVLDVWDLKFGMRGVEVENNGQLRIYALAAILKYSLLHNFQEVNLVIHQPRVKPTPTEWRQTPEELFVFGQKVTEAAALSLNLRGEATALSHLTPGDKQCFFCRARQKCPALAKQVHETVFGAFQDIDDPEKTPLTPEEQSLTPADLPVKLGHAMSAINLIEIWCSAVRAHVERLLFEGKPIPGWRLGLGRKGPRKFTDEDAVEKLLLATDLKAEVIYVPKKLKSPTQLEKPLANMPVWETLQSLIKQEDGKPSVVSEDDPRPPYTPNASAAFDSYDGKDLV